MFFDIYNQLCESNQISTYKAAQAIGLNRAIIAKWKNGSIPNGDTLQKLAAFFNVSVDYLLTGVEKKEAAPEGGDITFDDFSYAMYNESKELSEHDKQILLSLAKQLREAPDKK